MMRHSGLPHTRRHEKIVEVSTEKHTAKRADISRKRDARAANLLHSANTFTIKYDCEIYGSDLHCLPERSRY